MAPSGDQQAWVIPGGFTGKNEFINVYKLNNMRIFTRDDDINPGCTMNSRVDSLDSTRA